MKEEIRYMIPMFIFALGLLIASCTGYSVAEDYQEDKYRQNVIRDQILNHGAGGCTPNVSTGGCL